MGNETTSTESKSGSESKKRIKPVVSRGGVVSTKKPLSKKMAETFMSEDVNDVKSWLFMDVIIPGIKNTILDIIQMMFFGEIDGRRHNRDRRDKYDNHTSYGSYYRGGNSSSRSSYLRSNRDRYDSDDRTDFRNIVLRVRGDAERVVDELKERIHKDGSASVADLLDLIDVPGRYTDNNYGWIDERDIGIRRVSNGYLIDVSEPKYLD